MSLVIENWEETIAKILGKISLRKEADDFCVPVDWRAFGLLDYLDIIKHPMDIGTVLTKLKSKEYNHPLECVAEVRLTWLNALQYNSPGTKIYINAKKLSDIFESCWAAAYTGVDENRPPTSEELVTWIDRCYSINPTFLGDVIMEIGHRCPSALTRKSPTSEVEVNVDLITGKVFRELVAAVDQLPQANGRDIRLMQRSAPTRTK